MEGWGDNSCKGNFSEKKKNLQAEAPKNIMQSQENENTDELAVSCAPKNFLHLSGDFSTPNLGKLRKA